MTDKTVPTQQLTIPVVLMLTLHPDEREQEKEREAEMCSLLDTAGRRVVGTLVQHVQKPTSGTYIGSGKVEELKELAVTSGAQQVVFDVRLRPRQAGWFSRLSAGIRWSAPAGCGATSVPC